MSKRDYSIPRLVSEATENDTVTDLLERGNHSFSLDDTDAPAYLKRMQNELEAKGMRSGPLGKINVFLEKPYGG